MSEGKKKACNVIAGFFGKLIVSELFFYFSFGFIHLAPDDLPYQFTVFWLIKMKIFEVINQICRSTNQRAGMQPAILTRQKICNERLG